MFRFYISTVKEVRGLRQRLILGLERWGQTNKSRHNYCTSRNFLLSCPQSLIKSLDISRCLPYLNKKSCFDNLKHCQPTCIQVLYQHLSSICYQKFNSQIVTTTCTRKVIQGISIQISLWHRISLKA